jgi:hypothetical protein
MTGLLACGNGTRRSSSAEETLNERSAGENTPDRPVVKMANSEQIDSARSTIVAGCTALSCIGVLMRVVA